MKLFTKKSLTLGVATLGLFGTLAVNVVNAADTTGDAIAEIIAALTITNTADLDFGTAEVGEASTKVVAATDPEAGTFDVTGEANTAYDITLPTTINMTTGDGIGADKQIVVNTFTSNPSGSGNTGGTGTQELEIGATRAAISGTQVTGSYTGSYTVTVAYQ